MFHGDNHRTDMTTSTRDTLPKKGRVNEVCREWLVHEDQALAYHLQKQEVEQHYMGNKTRNAQVREDSPWAKSEQQKELEEARKRYKQIIETQADLDSQYAAEFASEIRKEELLREKSDLEVALKYQEKELAKAVSNFNNNVRNSMSRRGECSLPFQDRLLPSPNHIIKDASNPHVRSKCSSNRLSRVNHNNYSQINFNARNYDEPSTSRSIPGYLYENVPPDIPVNFNSLRISDSLNDDFTRPRNISTSEEDDSNFFIEDQVISADEELQRDVQRIMQEQKDAELAKKLQEEEEKQKIVTVMDKDRLMAIESRDKELAKLLQEKEEAKLKRARERTRKKALMRKQTEMELEMEGNLYEIATNSNDSYLMDNPSTSDTDRKPMPNYMPIEDEENFQYDRNNVAIAIDPTYKKKHPTSAHTIPTFQPDIAPYVPVQGQRRNTLLQDVKPKKSKLKDSCKQQ